MRSHITDRNFLCSDSFTVLGSALLLRLSGRSPEKLDTKLVVVWKTRSHEKIHYSVRTRIG